MAVAAAAAAEIAGSRLELLIRFYKPGPFGRVFCCFFEQKLTEGAEILEIIHGF